MNGCIDVTIMRTTINLADALLVEAKELAATKGTSLTRVLEESLRLYLVQERGRAQSARSPRSLPIIRDAVPEAGVDLDDTSTLLVAE
jgi:hypothetical protein